MPCIVNAGVLHHARSVTRLCLLSRPALSAGPSAPAVFEQNWMSCTVCTQVSGVGANLRGRVGSGSAVCTGTPDAACIADADALYCATGRAANDG